MKLFISNCVHEITNVFSLVSFLTIVLCVPLQILLARLEENRSCWRPTPTRRPSSRVSCLSLLQEIYSDKCTPPSGLWLRHSHTTASCHHHLVAVPLTVVPAPLLLLVTHLLTHPLRRTPLVVCQPSNVTCCVCHSCTLYHVSFHSPISKCVRCVISCFTSSHLMPR